MKGQISSTEFLRWSRDYVGPSPTINEADSKGQPGQRIPLASLKEHRFYVFDAETCHAISHAIEVLALEHATGRVIGLLGDFAEFESHEECYSQLAATVENVVVFGHGRSPRVKGLHFRQDAKAKGFRGIVHTSRDAGVAFLCKELSSKKQSFRGFFSVTPHVVKKLALELDAAPKDSSLAEYERLEAIDRAAKELDREWQRQRSNLDTALQRLQADPQYSMRQFGAEVDKGLASLSGWKSRLDLDRRERQ